MVAIVPPPISVAYISSKFATLGIALALRNELADTRVGISVLCPGMSATNIVATTALLRPGCDLLATPWRHCREPVATLARPCRD